ncbi:Delta(8)-fatty-acid desaturase 2, partial [Lamellibrachia satsuma]
FMDWYYGGLNFHIEHHLYPKMARKHLRAAGPYIKAVCIKHGIDYEMLSFVDAIKKTLSHMKRVGD